MPDSMWLTKVEFASETKAPKEEVKTTRRGGGMFGGRRKARSSRSNETVKKEAGSNFNTLVIDGHCLYGKNRINYVEEFKSSINNSKFFDAKNITGERFSPDPKFNVNSFSMKVKLNKTLTTK